MSYIRSPKKIFFFAQPYVFRPAGQASPIAAAPISWSVSIGAYVSQVRQVFSMPCPGTVNPNASCGLSQTFRLYHSSNNTTDFDDAVELIHDAGPLQPNTDLAVRFVTSLQNNGMPVIGRASCALNNQSF